MLPKALNSLISRAAEPMELAARSAKAMGDTLETVMQMGMQIGECQRTRMSPNVLSNVLCVKYRCLLLILCSRVPCKAVVDNVNACVRQIRLCRWVLGARDCG